MRRGLTLQPETAGLITRPFLVCLLGLALQQLQHLLRPCVRLGKN
jgi:hypothetical protein